MEQTLTAQTDKKFNQNKIKKNKSTINCQLVVGKLFQLNKKQKIKTKEDSGLFYK